MRGRNQNQEEEAQQRLEVWVAEQLICPISLEMMKDPVTVCTGITYDRHSIQTWLEAGNDVCPATRQRLHARDLIPNHTLSRLIHRCCLRDASMPAHPTSADLARLLRAAAGGEGQLCEGAAEGVVRLLAEDCRRPSAAANACIACIQHMAGAEPARENLVRAGAVAALVEILREAERGACEKALAALDALCECAPGRSAAREHALTVAVVVKKMLRVSDLATQLAVSVLWAVCHDDGGSSSDGSAVLEALQAGALLKLLVLLQIGCEGKTRERATGLLKLFNKCAAGQWDRCADTLDLKQVRRSF